MTQVASLAQRGEIQQAARHRVPVVDVRRGQHDAAAGCRVRLTVLCPAPLAPAARPDEPDEPGSQFPVWRVVVTAYWHLTHGAWA